MTESEKLDRIIELLEQLLLRDYQPHSENIDYWRCKCGMENITLTSSPRICSICQEHEPLRIEAAR